MSESRQATIVGVSNTILKKPPFSVRRITTECLSLVCGPTRACRRTAHLCDGAHSQLFRSRGLGTGNIPSRHGSDGTVARTQECEGMAVYHPAKHSPQPTAAT